MSLHILRSHPSYGWKTGKDTSGQRLIAGVYNGVNLVIRFSESGQLQDAVQAEDQTTGDAWSSTLISQEKGIRVHPFELLDYDIAVTQIPAEYREFTDNAWDYDPGERAHFSVLVNEWKERHHFVFRWGHEHWCDEDGHVTRCRKTSSGVQDQ